MTELMKRIVCGTYEALHERERMTALRYYLVAKRDGLSEIVCKDYKRLSREHRDAARYWRERKQSYSLKK